MEVFIPICVIAVVVGITLSLQVRRANAIQRLAERKKFGFDGELPRDFPMNSLEFLKRDFLPPRWIMGDEHEIGGWEGKDFLLAFDLVLGTGRQRSTLTVVARRSGCFQPMPKLRPSIRVVQVGDWRVLVKRRFLGWSLLQTEAIEQAWVMLKGQE